MPGSDVKKRAKDQEVSLRTLESLAAHYRVSLEAMFIRLRTLKMWDAELSLWHKMTNGTFAVKRIWGAQRVDWKWLDESIPNRALAASPDAISSGQDFWLQHSPDGPRFKPVSYQVGRHRGDLIVLLIRKKTRSIRPDSLFKPRGGRLLVKVDKLDDLVERVVRPSCFCRSRNRMLS